MHSHKVVNYVMDGTKVFNFYQRALFFKIFNPFVLFILLSLKYQEHILQ